MTGGCLYVVVKYGVVSVIKYVKYNIRKLYFATTHEQPPGHTYDVI